MPIFTPYGQYSATPGGGHLITGDPAQIHAWATRPGHSWPCSGLDDGVCIMVTFASNGDLVEFLPEHELDGLTADELNAWTDDVRALARQ